MQVRTCIWSLATLLCLVPGAALPAEEVARPTAEAPLALPLAWQGVSTQDRLVAVRVAEVDADRLLCERIYGLQVDADTSVLDLAMQFDDIRAGLDAMIRGVRTREVKYCDDLSVEVVREVTIREVIETIQRVIRREETKFSVKVDQIENISRRTRDTVVAVMGNGAVPGSLGLRKIQAKRAAEADCYRRIAERVLGVRITSDTWVRNFALESDLLLTQVAGCLTGIKFTSITYGPDQSCKVAGRLVLRELLERLQRSYKRSSKDGRVKEEDWQRVLVESRDTVIGEIGEGAPIPQGREKGVSAVPGRAYLLQRTIIQRIVGREVGSP